MAGPYENWTQAQLIAKVHELENQLKTQNNASSPGYFTPNTTISNSSRTQDVPYKKKLKQVPRPFNASKYSTRLIALKFAYLGQGYNGFEHHKNNSTPLPTIEEELWKALVKTKLISPVTNTSNVGGTRERRPGEREGADDVSWEGCEYTKCGRTDRGVSAFGQVIGVRVRSNRPVRKPASVPTESVRMAANEPMEGEESSLPIPPTEASRSEPLFDDRDELPYIQLLNRVLPPAIRIYAWCPNPPSNFSARFHCKERRYKYFFTNPCFAPVPGTLGLYTTNSDGQTMREGWLDIEAMRTACTHLIGLHDFRNMCKIDASKQITNFKRRIFHASITEVSPLLVPSFLSHIALRSPSSPTEEQPKLYAFELHGSAFLWHQVRTIISLLFHIGQGLESPSLILSLLDISTNPCRPKYDMASDVPLVLWDCIFPSEDEVQDPEERDIGYADRLRWIYVGDEGDDVKGSLGRGGVTGVGKGKWGRGGVVDDVWEVWRRAKMEETLAGLLLDTIAAQGVSTLDEEKMGKGDTEVGIDRSGPRGFDGGDLGKARGGYIRVLDRERQEPVEIVNGRYARKKGLDKRRPSDDVDE